MTIKIYAITDAKSKRPIGQVTMDTRDVPSDGMLRYAKSLNNEGWPTHTRRCYLSREHIPLSECSELPVYVLNRGGRAGNGWNVDKFLRLVQPD